ncbi:hypothetical protein [Citrobacter sp. L55]|uniref:hypothetical protein n=1 Tax=Citrobacter sp. L55 TaxID=1981983 RepID=UPI00117F36E7|nr:hypothetical protein [Citrobacter sp. L55]
MNILSANKEFKTVLCRWMLIFFSPALVMVPKTTYAAGWTYNCVITNRSGYLSTPNYSYIGTSTVPIKGELTLSTTAIITTNSSVNFDLSDTYQNTLKNDLLLPVRALHSAANTNGVSGSGAVTAFLHAWSAPGVTGIQSPPEGGRISDVIGVTTASYISPATIHYESNSKQIARTNFHSGLSTGTDISNPITNYSVTSSIGPLNEYAPSSMSFTITMPTIAGSYLNIQNYRPTGGFSYAPSYNNLGSVVCSRNATPLSLTITPPNVNFGTAIVGSTNIIAQPITWSTSGSGQAGTWTLTFDSATKTGNYINLGGANISILDTASNQVPLGTPLNIGGTSGSYTLSLDPSTGTDGTKSANLSVTVTAN